MLYSVISLGAVGFLLSIVFLFLSAPDLAITQLAVEIITLVILLKATSRTLEKTERGGRATAVLVVAMISVLVVLGGRMFVDFPDFGNPVMDRFADAPSNTYLEDGLEKTGAPNSVTAILLDFRAYDTLGEAAVLFCAVMGRAKYPPQSVELPPQVFG